MKVLITGTTGMVGRNLTEAFKSKFELIPNSRASLNLENYPQTFEFIKMNRPDLVIHAAGYVGGIQKNIQEIAKFYFVNTTVGFNLSLSTRRTSSLSRSLACGYQPCKQYLRFPTNRPPQ